MLVGLDHLHAPLVSIREQAAHVVAVLRRGDPVTFRELIAREGLFAEMWRLQQQEESGDDAVPAIAKEPS